MVEMIGAEVGAGGVGATGTPGESQRRSSVYLGYSSGLKFMLGGGELLLTLTTGNVMNLERREPGEAGAIGEAIGNRAECRTRMRRMRSRGKRCPPNMPPESCGVRPLRATEGSGWSREFPRKTGVPCRIATLLAA